MAKPDSAQIEEPPNAVVPITDPDGDESGSADVKKRPFALDKRGSGRGNIPFMLMLLGPIMVFGIGNGYASF